ncbi:hypothetical protein D3C76_1487900 [compost metagenome]
MGLFRHLRHRPFGLGFGGHHVLRTVHRRVQMVAVTQPGGELRIIAGTAKIHHHFAGNLHCPYCTALAVNQMQRQIDTGGNAGAGVQVAVFNKDTVLFHLRGRGLLTHAFDYIMVGGALIAVE